MDGRTPASRESHESGHHQQRHPQHRANVTPGHPSDRHQRTTTTTTSSDAASAPGATAATAAAEETRRRHDGAPLLLLLLVVRVLLREGAVFIDYMCLCSTTPLGAPR